VTDKPKPNQLRENPECPGCKRRMRLVGRENWPGEFLVPACLFTQRIAGIGVESPSGYPPVPLRLPPNPGRIFPLRAGVIFCLDDLGKYSSFVLMENGAYKPQTHGDTLRYALAFALSKVRYGKPATK
jgi:hypothetical protein